MSIRHVLYIVVDTLRADHLSCYGYHRKITPSIDRLAKQGILFSNVYPSDVPTQPSYTAMFTGKRGISTGVVSHSQSESLLDKEIWYPQILTEKGYETAAVSTLYYMKKYFARGFKSYLNPTAGSPRLIQRVTADQINKMAIPWLRQNCNKNFFLFLHYWDPHTPYIPPQQYRNLYYQGDKSDPGNYSLDGIKDKIIYPFVKRLLDTMAPNITDIEYVIAQYDSEITYIDEKLGEIIEVVRQLGILDDTLIIVTADHGESLGEHGIYFDHAGVYEPTVHVPLIFRHSSLPPGEKIKALIQLIDLAPTIFEFLNLEVPKKFEGKSLLPLMKGETGKHYKTIYTNQGLWQASRMIRDEKFKLIKFIDRGFWPGPMTELFNLKEDPEEQVNLAEREKEIVDKLELELIRWEAEKLGKRLDPLRLIANRGLPPTQWIGKLIKQDRGTYEEWRKRMGW